MEEINFGIFRQKYTEDNHELEIERIRKLNLIFKRWEELCDQPGKTL